MKIKDKDVLMIDKFGNIQKVFKNYADATKTLKIGGRSLIQKICAEEYGSCRGYYWLDGKAYKKKIENLTFGDWLSNNVKITKHIDRNKMPIVKLDKYTYELLDRYSSLEEAVNLNGFNSKNVYDSIIKCCKLTRRTAKGFIWLLEEDYNSKTIDEIKQIHNEINNVNPNSKKINRYTMPVVKLDKDSYKLIARYSNILEAAKENGIDKKTGYDGISRCCRFGKKSSHGFKWLLEEDYKNMSIEEITDRFNGKKPSFIDRRKGFDKTPIVQLNPRTYEFIKVFESADKAEEELDINKNGILKCCKMQRKTSGGYCWMFVEDFKKYSLDEIKGLYGKIFWN